MIKKKFNSIEQVISEIIDTFDQNNEVKCLVDLEVAEELSDIYTSEDFNDYFMKNIQSDVDKYIVEKVRDEVFVIQPLYDYNSEVGTYMIESEISEASVITFDIDELTDKERKGFLDAEIVINVTYEEYDYSNEFEDDEECDEEEDSSDELFDFVQEHVEEILKTFCPYCQTEMIHKLAVKMYNLGYETALLSVKENIDNELE